MKKFGGKIKDWTINNLSSGGRILTGYVASDPLGRWEIGWHMRSSLIVTYDEDTGIVETENTIYHLEGEGTGGDMGDVVLAIYY